MQDETARSRFFPPALVLLGIAAAAAGMQARALQTSAAAADAPPSAREVLNKYCVTCHNGRLKTAGLEIDNLDLSDASGHAAQLEKIVTKLRTREMPPPGRPRPDAATYTAVAERLEQDLDAAAAANPYPGRVPVHRLNRSEYANAVRDLVGLDIDS